MKVYTCNDFDGYYPVGTGAVVIAINAIQASYRLEKHLGLIGLKQSITPSQMIELDTESATVRILTDGNY